jgi:hypothetical protein
MAVILLACGCNGWPPGIDDIGTFKRERQLWLDRNYQNYSVTQTRWDSSGPEDTTLFVINGIPKYFRAENAHYDDSLGGYPSVGHIYALDEFESAGTHTLFGSVRSFARMSVSEIYAELAEYAHSTRYRINITYDGGHLPYEIGIHSSSVDIVWNINYLRNIDPGTFGE